jgi:hypothetical protein
MVRRSVYTVVSAVAVLSFICQSADAQKPAVQMPGDNGKVGVPYVLGPKGQEFVFTLEKAEFASRAFIYDSAVFAQENQRVLIVTFAVQNPGKADRFFQGNAFKFTVVSPDDKNYTPSGYVYHPETLETISTQLKPAQKIRAFFAVAIHPKGVVNKLIVQPASGPVLRYDLRGKVKPMTDVFASENGIDTLDVGKAKVGPPFGLGYFDFAMEKLEESAAESGGFKPGDGNKLFIATMTVKNVSKTKPTFAQNYLVSKLVDENGEEMRLLGMAKMSGPEPPAHQNFDLGQQLRFRLVFEGPSAAKPVNLKLTDIHSRRSVLVSLK